MKGFAQLLVMVSFLGASTSLLAHGEGTPGPNGGKIRMPGAFHTELVATKDDKIWRVFLLDIAFKNPVTADSTVQLKYRGEAFPLGQEAACAAKRNFFECHFKAAIPTQAGTIEVTASRQGLAGGVAQYELPLKP